MSYPIIENIYRELKSFGIFYKRIKMRASSITFYPQDPRVSKKIYAVSYDLHNEEIFFYELNEDLSIKNTIFICTATVYSFRRKLFEKFSRTVRLV